MKSHVLMFGCLTLASAALVVAADDNMKTSENDARSMGNTAQQTMESGMHSALATMSPDKLEGKDIMDSAGKQLGDVDSVMTDKANRRMVVIGLEDSLKEVVVPLDKLTLSADGETLSTTLTRAELLAMPDHDPMDEAGDNVSSSAIVAGKATDSTMATQKMGNRSLATMSNDDLEGKDILDSAGNQLGDVDSVMTDEANRRMVVIGLEDSVKEVVVPLDKLMLSADGETFSTTMSPAELLAMPDHDPMDEVGDDDAAHTDNTAMASGNTTAAGMDHSKMDHGMNSALATMEVDKLEGKDIMDSAGKQLGDIDEIVVDKANQRMAVIGLEDSVKEVVVPLNKLQLSADGETLTTQITRDELLAMPDYDPMDMKSADE